MLLRAVVGTYFVMGMQKNGILSVNLQKPFTVGVYSTYMYNSSAISHYCNLLPIR